MNKGVVKTLIVLTVSPLGLVSTLTRVASQAAVAVVSITAATQAAAKETQRVGEVLASSALNFTIARENAYCPAPDLFKNREEFPRFRVLRMDSRPAGRCGHFNAARRFRCRLARA